MPDPGSCPNCGRRHDAALPAYCPGCGQETALRPPTLAEFAQQFGGSYLSTEGALWRTLRLLLTRPGARVPCRPTCAATSGAGSTSIRRP